MSEANWNKQKNQNPLALASMEMLGCLGELGDREALSLRGCALSVHTGFGREHDAARRILLEAQVRGLRNLALRSGCETIVDFPCSCLYRPFTSKGLHYIGLGAAEVIEAAGAVREGAGSSFFPVDATNPASILQALESAGGSLCILSAGLFPTVTDPELNPLCVAVGQALRTHGGCWLTPDPEAPRAFMEILEALCGDRMMDVLLRSNDMRQWKVQGQFDNSLVIDPRWDRERLQGKALAFLQTHGLEAERIPLEMQALNLLSIPAGQTNEALRETIAALHCCKITAIAAQGHMDHRRAAGLDIVSQRKGDLLHLELCGRLDTLSSNDVFESFMEQNSDLRKVEIDCSELDYLSSGGIRVLLKILRFCTVTLLNPNEAVCDVMEKTGLDTLLQIRNGETRYV